MSSLNNNYIISSTIIYGLYFTDYSEQIEELKLELKNIIRLNKLKKVNNETNFISIIEIQNKIKDLENKSITSGSTNPYTTSSIYSGNYQLINYPVTTSIYPNNFIITTTSTTNTCHCTLCQHANVLLNMTKPRNSNGNITLVN